MTQRPDARPDPTPDALPLDLLPPLDRDSQISRPNPPGGYHRPVLQPEEPAAGSAGGAGARLDLLPTRLLIGKDGETRSIWPVHLAGWRALGWEVLTPALPAVMEPDPDLEGQQPELPVTGDPGPVPPDPEQPDGEAVEESPQHAELSAAEAPIAEEVPDFAAMTKAEIIQYCSTHYGVLLDSGLTKSALVAEAEALAAPRLPDALMDDMMT